MQYGLITYADSPTPTVMSLADAKLHLRVDFNADDALIDALIDAATLDCEAYCNAAFCSRDYRMTLGAFPVTGSGAFGPDQDCEEFPSRFGSSGKPTRFPAAIFLPVYPLVSVSSITYLDADGVEQTVSAANYYVVTSRRPPFIVPAVNQSWPATYDHPEAVKVNFRAGFGSESSEIPANIVAAVKLMLGHLYEHREDVTPGVGAPNPALLPMGSRYLLNPHRMWPQP